MTNSRRIVLALFIVLPTWPASGAEPSLVSIFPMGITRGESVEIQLSGTGLQEPQRVLFSRATIQLESRPEGRIAFRVERDTPQGEGDLWVLTPTGLSNPRRFVVNDLPMVVERAKEDPAGSAPVVKPPVIIAGTIDTPTDQDDYSVELDRDQQISIAFRSVSLEGSVLPALTVFAPDGQEWMHDRGGEAEPTLDLVAPTRGIYRIRVQDRAFRRDAASLYQLVIQATPRLVAAFPQLLTKGKRQRVELLGYRIPGGEPAGEGFAAGLMRLPVNIDAPTSGERDGAGLTRSHSVMLERFGYQHPGTSGSIKFELIDGTIVSEISTRHDSAHTAQHVPLGASIAGRFLQAAEIDWYRFPAKKGEPIWVEAVGERAGLAMDLDVAIYDLQGKLLTVFADTPHPKGSPKSFPLDTLDPMGTWKAPADGEYNLVIRDLYGPSASGPERAYRLTIEQTQEAVRVVAMHLSETVPRGLSLVPGGHAPLQLLAIRRGGHEAPITIRPLILIEGLTAKPATILANQLSASLVLDAAAMAPTVAGPIELVAETEVEGQLHSFSVLGATLGQDGKPPVVRLSDGITAAILAPRNPKSSDASP
ncbi:PPC domain-containing protein [Singulisphaera sp. Ch08]|uniref:PPC domain-containing protein n=1 Tax=Singulisphaera sp. Ch08 TaxID=3120278 RepID=A0AAU7CDD1_9BACT